jgi:hypothetical protein
LPESSVETKTESALDNDVDDSIKHLLTEGDSFVAVFPKKDGSCVHHIGRAVRINPTNGTLACLAYNEWHTDPARVNKYAAAKKKGVSQQQQPQPSKPKPTFLKLLPEFNKTEQKPFAFALRSIVMLNRKGSAAKRLLFHNGRLWLPDGGAFRPSDEGTLWRFAKPNEMHWPNAGQTRSLHEYVFHK